MANTAEWICAGCCAEYKERQGFCSSCFRTGIIIPNHTRVATGLVPVQAGVSAKDLAASDQTVFKLKAYPELILARNSFATMAGAPGSGKTTMSLRACEALQPSAFMALEEGIGPTLASKLRRLEIRTSRMMIEEPKSVNAVMEVVSREGLRCVVVDSGTVCSLLPEEWLSIARAKNIVVIATLQVTKEGSHAGSNRWLHDADVNLHVESLKWQLKKSRYQEANIAGEVI